MYKPTRTLNKVVVAATASAVSILLLYLVRRYLAPDLPDEVALAVTTVVTALVTWLSAYMTPLAPGEIARVAP